MNQALIHFEPETSCAPSVWYEPPTEQPYIGDRQREFCKHGPTASRQEVRRQEGLQLARALVQGLNHQIIVGKDGAMMVDTYSGEVVEGGPGECRAERFAALHWLAAQEGNHFTGILDMPDRDGNMVPVEVGGALATPSSRIDPNWMEVSSRRSRKVAKKAVKRAEATLPRIEKLKMEKGWRGRFAWAFLTLTLSKIESAKTVLECQRYNRAWSLFRKLQAFSSRVWGGVKSIEDKLTVFGPHVHGHTLILAKYWEHAEIKEMWTTCVRIATREIYGIELPDDFKAIVDIRMVKKKLRPGDDRSMSMDDALNECVKYVTKPSDLTSLRAETLLELEEIQRWPRMFELLGKARESKDARAKAAQPGSLDTACISDGEAKAETEPLPFDPDFSTAGTPLQAPEGGCLDPGKSERKPRPPTWRDQIETMSFSSWLARMVERVASARRFRAKWLCEAYPTGVLFTLEGRSLAVA